MKIKISMGYTVMKKLLASVLCLTLVMSLAACSNAKEPEQTTENTTTTEATTTTTEATTTEATTTTTTEPSEKTSVTSETSETSETTSESKAEGTSASVKDKKIKSASAYIEKKIEYGKMKDAQDRGYEDGDFKYCYPQLLINSSYADSVNKEIKKTVEKYKKAVNNEEHYLFLSTSYAAFITKEGVLSLVFISDEETDCNEYKVYNIDVTTGKKVDNARIAKIAGVSSIRKAAMDALQNFYNDKGWFKLENYKVVLEPGQEKDEQMKNVERSFGKKYLNDKMQIGLTDEGKLFFISTCGSAGGADFYDYVYDVNGYWLDEETNSFVPFDHGDDGEEDESDEGEDIQDEEEA